MRRAFGFRRRSCMIASDKPGNGQFASDRLHRFGVHLLRFRLRRVDRRRQQVFDHFALAFFHKRRIDPHGERFAQAVDVDFNQPAPGRARGPLRLQLFLHRLHAAAHFLGLLHQRADIRQISKSFEHDKPRSELFATAIAEVAELLSAVAFWRRIAELARTDIEQLHRTSHERLLRDLGQLFAPRRSR